MGIVTPIKDKKMLDQMKQHLREENTRNYLLFRIGINLGLSIPELLQLRVEDIVGKSEFLYGGYRIRISDSLQKEIAFYAGERKEGYLFRMKSERPITRFQLYKVLKNTAEAIGISELFGALTLRKTFAYWAYKEKRIYLPILSKYLGHHTTTHTLRYIDEPEDEAANEVVISEMDL